VDATAQTVLAGEFGVTSYPTLKLFLDGNRTHPLAYTGRAAAPGDGVAPIVGDTMTGAGVAGGDGERGGNVPAGVWQGGDGGQVTAQRWG